MKLHTYKNLVMFFCPGCKSGHHVIVPRWTFDGNVERPTITPSLRLSHNGNEEEGILPATICHLTITAGKIFFHPDTQGHGLRGDHEMVDFPKGYGLPGLEDGAP